MCLAELAPPSTLFYTNPMAPQGLQQTPSPSLSPSLALSLWVDFIVGSQEPLTPAFYTSTHDRHHPRGFAPLPPGLFPVCHQEEADSLYSHTAQCPWVPLCALWEHRQKEGGALWYTRVLCIYLRWLSLALCCSVGGFPGTVKVKTPHSSSVQCPRAIHVPLKLVTVKPFYQQAGPPQVGHLSCLCLGLLNSHSGG